MVAAGADWEREQEKGGERRGREWRGQGSSGLHLCTARRRAGERAQHSGGHAAAKASECTVGTVRQIQISNSTTKIQLKPIFRASVTSKPLSFGKIRSNQNCRATRHLQLFLKRQSLIQPGWRDTRLRRGVHEN